MPDDTYLDRLRVWEGNIQLQGKSGNAQQLIEMVNASPLFSGTEFRGSTRLDSRTGKEIFDLRADLRQPPLLATIRPTRKWQQPTGGGRADAADSRPAECALYRHPVAGGGADPGVHARLSLVCQSSPGICR